MPAPKTRLAFPLPGSAPPASTFREWLPIAGLLALNAVPVLGGLARLSSLVGVSELLPADPRSLAHPVAIGVHVVSVSIWGVLGAFQFSRRIRRHRPLWHRRAGWLLVFSGLVAAGSGLWLGHVYPPGELDGTWLYWIRVVAGVAMGTGIVLGVRAILRRELRSHRAWMTRAYALGLGAGTQVFTHVPLLLLESVRTETGRTLAMGAGWAINAAVAEWLLRRRPKRRGGSPSPSAPPSIPVAASPTPAVVPRRR